MPANKFGQFYHLQHEMAIKTDSLARSQASYIGYITNNEPIIEPCVLVRAYSYPLKVEPTLKQRDRPGQLHCKFTNNEHVQITCFILYCLLHMKNIYDDIITLRPKMYQYVRVRVNVKDLQIKNWY